MVFAIFLEDRSASLETSVQLLRNPQFSIRVRSAGDLRRVLNDGPFRRLDANGHDGRQVEDRERTRPWVKPPTNLFDARTLRKLALADRYGDN